MKGLGVSPGIGIGKAFIIESETINIEKIYISDTSSEVERLRSAINICKYEIDKLYLKTLHEIGEKEAMIFKSHEMMLEDESFILEIESKILNDNVNAEYALKETTTAYIELFENIKDDYLRERADDLKDIMNRVLRELLGIHPTDFSKMEINSVIIAKELTPSDTAQLDRNKVVAMITEFGGNNSHAAIMARIMGIPTVLGIKGILNEIKSNDLIICDGKTGIIIINPGNDDKKYYKQKKEEEDLFKNELKKLIGLPTVTKDGYKIELSSNIGTPEDMSLVLENDSEGIGLFRSEFIFMNRESEPTEDEQLEQYKGILKQMSNKPVIIRTLDIGGDKEVPYLDMPKEDNPFLGYRAIRLCLGNECLFKTQLRAILRSSVYGNVKIMFPMISTLKELRDAKKILEEAKQELRNENIEFKEDIELGIMIEIPSAAIISDLLAKEVDFFSIGTNDLIQYTMAVDRMNSKLAHLYSQYHPAMLRLIKSIIKNGHDAGIWVGMCGEAAGDPILIPLLIGMGLDELSMNSSSILYARGVIRNLDKQELEQIAENALQLEAAIDVENYLSNLFVNKNN
ncbi:MAG: ptsP [Bacillota bacterium]|jgi:phosphotransferase system enzyme I (PtsI)|nr:ptsP [Bacillota bacterium]